MRKMFSLLRTIGTIWQQYITDHILGSYIVFLVYLFLVKFVVIILLDSCTMHVYV